MIKCQSCGFMNDEGSAFCEECGTRLEKSIYCENCGNPLKPGKKFCSACGTKVSSDGTVPPSFGKTLGDKNIISGDVRVVGSQDIYNVYNASSMDGPHKIVECHVCGRNMSVIDSYTCKVCKKSVCTNCFDVKRRMCEICASVQKRDEDERKAEAIRLKDEEKDERRTSICDSDSFYDKEINMDSKEKSKIFKSYNLLYKDLRYDDETKHLGTAIKTGEIVLKIGPNNTVFYMNNNGDYVFTSVIDNVFVGKKGLFYINYGDNEIFSKTTFTIIYVVKKEDRKELMIKRFQISEFSLDKVYVSVPEAERVLKICIYPNAVIHVKYKEGMNYRVSEEDFLFEDFNVYKSSCAQGNLLTNKVVDKMTIRQLPTEKVI